MKSVLKGIHSTKANDEILTEDEDRKNITQPEECQEAFTSFYESYKFTKGGPLISLRLSPTSIER